MSEKDWEIIIGLEIHAELNTKSKLFSSAPNRFGDEPNTNITEVCTGQPGALPVLNKEALRKAVQFGLAINADIQKFSKFDRKSYFYPDSPRNFQITQFDEPIILGGKVVAEVGGEEKSFAVNRVHLEDDAGMLKHFSTFAGVDYNRAGVPLIEIVSEPCMRGAEEAVAYAMEVKAILEYLDASDCNMEEGSLRFDVNISVRPRGEKGYRNKAEIKNLNSFSYMKMAIESEAKRQIKSYTSQSEKDHTLVIPQATFRWDPEKKITVLMRRKEGAEDYRYFPEPDLVPIVLTDGYINGIRAHLPELPLERKRRYVRDMGISEHNAFVLTSDKKSADFFEECLKYSANGRAISNWLTVEFSGRFRDKGISIIESGILPKHVADLVNFIDNGTITGKIAKTVADEMCLHPGKSPEQIIEENPDLKPVGDTAEIVQFVDQVLRENPQSINDFKAGKDRAFGFLVGQVMKLSKGKAPPALVNQLLKDKMK
jgi:aspartyl-tRNA(Asn)/glutamyl-tRNA(Gln) amidotransferase subunit B